MAAPEGAGLVVVGSFRRERQLSVQDSRYVGPAAVRFKWEQTKIRFKLHNIYFEQAANTEVEERRPAFAEI